MGYARQTHKDRCAKTDAQKQMRTVANGRRTESTHVDRALYVVLASRDAFVRPPATPSKAKTSMRMLG